MTKIIGISGTKQSGKSTVANYICGKILQSKQMITDMDISNKGELEVQTKDSNGNEGWGIFDVNRKDEIFISYAQRNLWPYVKLYHFADYLKKICVDLFDLTPQQVYGSDNDKNTSTKYDMSAREFLQYFGTDVMRKIKDTVWLDYTIKSISEEKTEVALIPDVRFPNEVKAIKDAGGVVIRLTRNVFKSQHSCENSLSTSSFDWNNFDYIVDNEDYSLSDLCNSMELIANTWRT